MAKDNNIKIIRPVNYTWILVGMVALLIWQTIITGQSVMTQGIQGSNSQLMVYLVVLCLAFALKESALKPIHVFEDHCVIKVVMAKERVAFKDVQGIEVITKKGQMRTTHDLKLMRQEPVFIKDIAVYDKQDILYFVQRVVSESTMSDGEFKALTEKLDCIRFTKA